MLIQQTDKLIQGFVEQTKAILLDNLVGVYLHGSAVMGCFNPEKSDLDFIIVVKKPLLISVKRSYMELVVQYNGNGPAKGIELSIVLRDVCSPFVYPTPFDLHFSAGHLDWYKSDPDGYISKMNGTDKDLAAHFTIIRKRGRCLYGVPIEEVFSEVPCSDYMDSIWYDVKDAANEIMDNPMYLTLNLARMLAYKEQGLVLSKKEGGEWAINNLPEKYRPVIMDAMNEYSDNVPVVYDNDLAKQYAEYVIKQICPKWSRQNIAWNSGFWKIVY